MHFFVDTCDEIKDTIRKYPACAVFMPYKIECKTFHLKIEKQVGNKTVSTIQNNPNCYTFYNNHSLRSRK